MLVAPQVLFIEGLNILFVDVQEDRLDADLADNLLVDEARPQGQIILLKLEEVSALRIYRDLRVDKFGFVDATASKVVIVRDNPHLVLDEYERVLPPPPPQSGLYV